MDSESFFRCDTTLLLSRPSSLIVEIFVGAVVMSTCTWKATVGISSLEEDPSPSSGSDAESEADAEREAEAEADAEAVEDGRSRTRDTAPPRIAASRSMGDALLAQDGFLAAPERAPSFIASLLERDVLNGLLL